MEAAFGHPVEGHVKLTVTPNPTLKEMRKKPSSPVNLTLTVNTY